MAYPSRATPLQVDERDRRNRAPAPALPRAHDPNIAKRRYLRALFACVVLVGAFIVGNGNPAHAQNATWLSNPGTNSFNTGTNWSTGAVPTGTARFGASNTTTILFQPFTPTTIGTLQFDRGAPAYTFVTAPTLFTSIAITGTGIVNHSANAPTFVVGNQANLTFQNASTAGNANIITNNGGITLFTGTATGGDARLVANAGGVVDISGIANVNVGGSFFVPRAYTILSSSGLVIGRFDEVIDNRPSFEAEISYTPHKVIVTLFFDPLAAVSRPSAGGGAINQNQFSVLKAIVNSFNATGQIPVEFGNISTVHDLSELTGEVGTAVQQAAFNTMDRFLDTLLDPFLGERGGRAPIDSLAAYAPEDGKTAILRKAPPFAGGDVFPRWSQWATQYGGTQSTGGSPSVGSNDTRSNIFGVAAGADYRLLPDTLVGFGIGGAFTDFTVANGLGSGSDDSFQAGAYVRHSFGQAYVAAALAYGIHDLQTDRTVTIAGLDELHAQFTSHHLGPRRSGLSLCHALDGHHPVCRRPVNNDLPARPHRAVVAGCRRPVRALLRGQRRHCSTKRPWLPRRHIVCIWR
jgi:hypothetical protein